MLTLIILKINVLHSDSLFHIFKNLLKCPMYFFFVTLWKKKVLNFHVIEKKEGRNFEYVEHKYELLSKKNVVNFDSLYKNISEKFIIT